MTPVAHRVTSLVAYSVEAFEASIEASVEASIEVASRFCVEASRPYMIDTVRYVLYPLYQVCIRPWSRYSEIQCIVRPLYLYSFGHTYVPITPRTQR